MKKKLLLIRETPQKKKQKKKKTQGKGYAGGRRELFWGDDILSS